jgi:hypothetical protein
MSVKNNRTISVFADVRGAMRLWSARRVGLCAAAILVSAWAATPQAQAANIITFGDGGLSSTFNVSECSGSQICSTGNGTTGYDNSKAAADTPFNLSTINYWFQIDSDGVNHLATQTQAEPDGGAGGFLVVNDTGSAVTSWSITLTDTFTSSTPSVNHCSGSSGPYCDQFQANEPNGTYRGTSPAESLSGADIFSCSTATLSGDLCDSSGSNAVAEFEPDMITYSWSGLDIGAGDDFLITFASWNNASYATPSSTVPEPGSLALFASALAGLGLLGWLRRWAA